MLHKLKIFPKCFVEIQGGRKTFEVRKDDRPYAEGDLLMLQEWLYDRKEYTGRYIVVKMPYILRDPAYVKVGYCIMSIVKAGKCDTCIHREKNKAEDPCYDCELIGGFRFDESLLTRG